MWRRADSFAGLIGKKSMDSIEARWEMPSPRKTVSRMGEDYVCWSRMQAEAGQALEAIVRRKELERRAGRGMFCWGVGNAPAVITGALARLGEPVAAVFSIMKSRPKAVDVNPGRIVAWRRYFDVDGAIRPMPRHVLVTSRAESASGPKSRHFALMCWSDKPLLIQHGEQFDPAAYRNAGGTGAPVGASQVTALLKRASQGEGASAYEANLKAWLVAAYWVRLTDPIDCSPEFSCIDDLTDGSVDEWLQFVDRARHESELAEPSHAQQGCLL
ncbi:hypothetical protein BAE42_16205 [Mesorhizobium loti]|uniref:Uncharacterized protein n=2 Tax=Phyllobacteriaceae TaxID=69277 RepID=A0A6M7ULU3_9HYPH|nr:hypothetical protein BAE42_16205 [Mesorhizobium loti]OBQ62577.1 hypothetical protein A8146_15705 [Mesorhizobium loti]QKC79049.1 hypothetical protein EB233_29045 [Mesorhizobium erdmanii]